MTRSESAASTFFRASESKQNIWKRLGGDYERYGNYRSEIPVHFQSTNHGQDETHVVSCHHARNKRTIVRAWEIVVGDLILGVVASTSLSMDVAKRLSTPQRG